MFWVITAETVARLTSSVTARWPWFGSAPRHRLVGGRQGFRLLEDEPHGGVLRVGRVAVAFSLNYSRHGLNLAVSVD